MTPRQEDQIAAAAITLFWVAVMATVAALMWLVDHRERSRARHALTRERNHVTVTRKSRRRE